MKASQTNNEKSYICTMNICGISELSKTTIEKFLDGKRPFFVCLNETKKTLSSDFFKNFHTEASKTGNSGGVVLSVNQEILYTRINELDCPDLESVWILGLLGKLKLLIATACIRPKSVDCLKSFLQQLEAAQQFVETNQLDGSIFLGDLNARHDYWGDSTNNLHGLELYIYLQYKLSIINYGYPTFLSSNGNSIIGLIIVMGKLTQHTFFELSCDYDVEIDDCNYIW